MVWLFGAVSQRSVVRISALAALCVAPLPSCATAQQYDTQSGEAGSNRAGDYSGGAGVPSNTGAGNSAGFISAGAPSGGSPGTGGGSTGFGGSSSGGAPGTAGSPSGGVPGTAGSPSGGSAGTAGSPAAGASGSAGSGTAGAPGGAGSTGNGGTCAPAYAKTACLNLAVGTKVSAAAHNWTCANGNCRNCDNVAACEPGATGCPWGVVWTDNGSCK